MTEAGAVDRALPSLSERPVWLRRSTIGAAGMGLVVVYLLLLAIDGRRYAHVDTGDTNNLVQGSRALIQCVRDGDFVGCGRLEGSVQTAIFPYPALQYIPATILAWLSWSDRSILLALRWLSFVSLVGVLAVFTISFRRRQRVLWLAWAVLIGSSLVYQANASFGEALAAFAVVASVAAAASRRPIATGAFAAVACLGKETLPLFILVLCLICARDRHDGWFPPRRMTVSIVVGSVAGAVWTALFNVLRFGGPRNALYLDDPLRTPGLGRQIEWFAALWVAPAGGVAWFWPGFMVVMIVSVIVAARMGSIREVALAAIPTIMLVGFLGGLALWFAPFGWITFGPRLAVPLLPAFLFAVLWTNGERIVSFLGRTRSRAVAVIVGLPVLSIPMYGAPWRWWGSIQDLIRSNTPSCPGMTEFSVYEDPATYYRCTSKTMWRLHPQILDDTIALARSIAGIAWLFALVGCTCLLVAALLPFSMPEDDGSDLSVELDERLT